MNELKHCCKTQDVTACVSSKGTMFSVFFGIDSVSNFDDVASTSDFYFNAYFHAMLEGGIFLPPSKFETCFTSTEHNESHLNQTLDVFSRAIKQV